MLFSPSRSKMPKFRENRIALLYARQQRLINDEKFLLLYNFNTSASPDFPYWTYDNFDLDSLSGESMKLSFASIEMKYIRCLMFCNCLTKLYATIDSMLMVPRLCVSCLKDSHIHVDILTLCQGLPNLFHSYAWYQIM